MRHLCCRIILTAVVTCVSAVCVYAFDSDVYTTPNNWSQQVTAGQFKESVTGIGLTQNSRLYMTLTTRLRLKSNDYTDDQDIYQYARMHTDAVKLGNGTVKVAAFGRLADDINGDTDKDWNDKNFYSQRDVLDTELDNNDLAPRLFYGYVQFDGVVKNTKATLGRFYLDHLNTFQLDGADVTVKATDYVSFYAFGGMPVSYFYDLDDDSVVGGGAALNFKDKTKLTAEYAYLDVQDIDDDYSKFRLVQMIPGGSFMVNYTILNDAGTLNADLDYQVAATDTIITLGYEGLMDKVDEDKTYVVNPLTYALLPQEKYNKYSVSVYQAFMKHFAAGLRYETKSVDGTDNFDNRDYDKYGIQFDINGLPHPDTYISFTADKWEIDSTADTKDNSSMKYGLQVSQKINDELDVWLGSAYNRYEYDYTTDKRKDSVRSYYVGGQYQPFKTVGFMADLSREDTDLYDDTDSDLETSYTAELWVNIVF